MTLIQYNVLSLSQKMDLLRDFGLLIDEKIKESERIRLYNMGDFFVEECLNFENRIKYIRGIDSVMSSNHYVNPLHVFHLN
jgi:hypothetical protein